MVVLVVLLQVAICVIFYGLCNAQDRQRNHHNTLQNQNNFSTILVYNKLLNNDFTLETGAN